MADGGAASQDESSGPGNDYSILHIHTHIQTVLLTIYDQRNTNEMQTDEQIRMIFRAVLVSTQLANCNLTEEETSYCNATANYMETCLPPLCD